MFSSQYGFEGKWVKLVSITHVELGLELNPEEEEEEEEESRRVIGIQTN